MPRKYYTLTDDKLVIHRSAVAEKFMYGERTVSFRDIVFKRVGITSFGFARRSSKTSEYCYIHIYINGSVLEIVTENEEDSMNAFALLSRELGFSL